MQTHILEQNPLEQSKHERATKHNCIAYSTQ